METVYKTEETNPDIMKEHTPKNLQFKINKSKNNSKEEAVKLTLPPDFNKNLPNEINPILFDKTHSLIPFLDSYFKVKPMLITKHSLYKFRIVI